MPSSCCVPKCTNRYSKRRKLFRFPRDSERLDPWVRAIRHDKWVPNEYSRICYLHFVSKRPSPFKDNPDYVPSKFIFNKSNSSQEKVNSIDTRGYRKEELD